MLDKPARQRILARQAERHAVGRRRLRDFFLYRDLGIAGATGGRVIAQLVKTVSPADFKTVDAEGPCVVPAPTPVTPQPSRSPLARSNICESPDLKRTAEAGHSCKPATGCGVARA